MAYTNSKMVAYTKLSPNHSGQRTHSIDRITPHCVVSQCTAEGLGDWFAKASTQASSNYGIDKTAESACISRRRTVLGAPLPMPTTREPLPSSALLIPRSLTG